MSNELRKQNFTQNSMINFKIGNLVCDGDLFLVLADLPATEDLHKHENHGWQPQIANSSFIGFEQGYYFYFLKFKNGFEDPN